MSFLSDCIKVGPWTTFRGPNLLADEEDIKSFDALSAQGVEFVEGQVRTRRGFGSVWNPAKAITTIYNWLQSAYNRLLYFHSGTTVVSRDLVSAVESDIIAGLTAKAMVCAQAGWRVYMAFFGTDGLGATEARCWDGNFTGVTPNVEKCFSAPYGTFGISYSEPDPGLVTVGTHRVGFIWTTKNGYETKPITQQLGLYLWFGASGGKNVKVTLSPATVWPVGYYSIQIILTTVNNLERYYLVPGGTALVPGGSAIPIDFTISLSDVTLAGRAAEEATEYFDLLCQDGSGNGPFKPFCILGYNNRMVYLTDILAPDSLTHTSGAYISDMYAPQWITNKYHLLNLPEFRQITTAFVHGGTLYLLGPSWTYRVSDNTDWPIKWSPPQLVDSRIGSPFIRGVCPNASRGWVWVVDQTGLFNFQGGIYPALPASHRQETDWKRINFAAPPECLKIIDNNIDNMVYVMAPLDGAITPTHILAWNYEDGVDGDRVKYCGLWPIGGGYLPGDIEIVQHPTTKRKEIWMSPYTAGKILRQKYEPADAVATIYNDDGYGYESNYELSVAGVGTGVQQQVGDSLRVRGAGVHAITVSSLDGTRSHACRDLTLSTAPGKRELVLYDLQSEGCRLKISNKAAAGSYFILSALDHYMKPWMVSR